jgi:hypothetical protein
VARPADVRDEPLRQALLQAERALDEGEYRAAVEACVAAYERLVELRPDMLIPPRFSHSAAPPQLGRPGAPAGPPGGVLVPGAARPWPSDHGVRLDVVEGQPPRLTLTKERFTLSEAATYVEYTLDMALRAQRQPG